MIFWATWGELAPLFYPCLEVLLLKKWIRKKCVACPATWVPNFLLHFSQSLKFYNRCEKTHWSASVVSQKLQSDKNYEKPWKSRKNGPSWKIKKPLVNDWVLPTFCPLFLLYRRRKWHFDHVFELFFAPAPDPSKIDFLSFWRKILTFVNKSVQTLWSSSIVFNDCVTHAVMFLIQRVLWALMKSIWRIYNARGFKNCATRTVSDFINPMRSSYLSCQTHFQCSMFLLLSTLSITSIALDPLWVSGRHPHSLRLWAYEDFQVLLRCFFLFAQQMCPLLLIAPLALNV